MSLTLVRFWNGQEGPRGVIFCKSEAGQGGSLVGLAGETPGGYPHN